MTVQFVNYIFENYCNIIAVYIVCTVCITISIVSTIGTVSIVFNVNFVGKVCNCTIVNTLTL